MQQAVDLQAAETRPPSGGAEWPTIGLAVVIYGGWLLLTYWHARIALPVLAVAGGWVTAWHGSLQHEVIHRHPTRVRGFNRALGLLPLSLWLPLDIYSRSHLTHHATPHLTDPRHDPESHYLAPGAGLAHGLSRAALQLQGGLLGRLVLGPPVQIGFFLAREFRTIVRGEGHARREWSGHVVVLAPVLVWLRFVCHLPLGEYILCFVYPGAALSLLRSFAEHRAAPLQARRVAIVERAPILGLLFLNNNLHAAHHVWPSAPWYRLGGLYAAHRGRLLADNGGLVYDGYGEVARRYLFSAHDRFDHAAPEPLGGAS